MTASLAAARGLLAAMCGFLLLWSKALEPAEPVPKLRCSGAYGVRASRPGLEPVPSALEGRLSTTGPSGKS